MVFKDAVIVLFFTINLPSERCIMLNIGILVFDDVEALDLAGPYEVFTTAARVHGRSMPGEELFRCVLIAADMQPVRARAGLRVLPDRILLPAADIDVLIVPGGDISQAVNDMAVIDWVRQQAQHASIVASVCTGAFLLAKAGLLDGLTVTTHWEDQADLQAQFSGIKVEGDLSWIDCGKFVTSGGISAGVDMSLHLVERLAGRKLALATARQMEYRWNENGTYAPRHAHDASLLSPA